MRPKCSLIKVMELCIGHASESGREASEVTSSGRVREASTWEWIGRFERAFNATSDEFVISFAALASCNPLVANGGGRIMPSRS